MQPVFKTNDGKEFDTEEEAVRHESVLGKEKVITEWIEKHYDNKRLTKKHLNVIMAYESYRDDIMRAI